MQCQFIRTCTALGVVGIAGTAVAGGGERFDVSWTAANIFPFSIAENGQDVDTSGLGGRFIASWGHSNVDIDVCWNTGASYTNSFGEIQFVMELVDASTGPAGGLFFVAPSPFDGDTAGAASEGTCANRVLAAEVDNPFPAFTYQVPEDGIVSLGISSTFDDGTGLAAGVANTASMYFTLGADTPAGCVDATGSCSEANGTPGCEDEVCCALNCDENQGGDPFCCSSSWDSVCAETAIALCGIFLYSCDAPAGANDCATSPQMVTVGESIAFDTTGFNTDGPGQPECGSGAGFEQLDSDAWYMIEIAEDGVLKASTCNQATFDTKIAVYNAGAIGETFDPAFLETAFVACDEDGTADDGTACADFTSFARVDVSAGNQYLIRVGGYGGESGSGTLSIDFVGRIPAANCDDGGPDIASQIVPGIEPSSFGIVSCQTAPGTPDASSSENNYARVYSAADLGGDVFTLDCVEIPMGVTAEYVEASINLLRSLDGSVAVYSDLELIASQSVGLYQNPIDDTDPEAPVFVIENKYANFGGIEIDLSDGSSLVVEIVLPDIDAGFHYVSGGPASDNASGVTYLRSAGCGITEYLDVASIGFDATMHQNLIGTLGGGGTPCPTDFNGDLVTDGADFGTILAQWGPCPGCSGDLDGDDVVGGSDVGQILAAWGPCAP